MKSDLAELIAGQGEGARLGVGQVVSFAAFDVTVDLGGATPLTVARLRSYDDPVVGDIVYVVADGNRRVCLGATSDPANPPDNPFGVPPEPITEGTATFPAVDAATLRGNWRTDTQTLYQGDATGGGLNTGVWFYGPAINATLEGATVTDAHIWLRRDSEGAGNLAPTLWRHQLQRRTATPVLTDSFAASALKPGEGRTVNVPTDTAQALVDAPGGLAMHVAATSPFIGIEGLDTDGRSGALTITWRR